MWSSVCGSVYVPLIRFSHVVRNPKNEKRHTVFRTVFHISVEREKRKTNCISYFRRISSIRKQKHGVRKTNFREYCLSCVTFNTEWEKRKTTSWTVFLIPRAQRKTKYGNTVRISFFVFFAAYGMRKTSGATVVFRFFRGEIVPEMRNAEKWT